MNILLQLTEPNAFDVYLHSDVGVPRAAGDVSGHEFHGNQYTPGSTEHASYDRGFYHGQTGYGFQKHVAGRKGTTPHKAYRKGYDAGVDASGDLRHATARQRDNTPLHRAADKHLNSMTLAVMYAFLKGKKVLRASLRTAGDVEGHEFHGNQYSTSYHGTKAENVDKILKEGIKPDSLGSVWATKTKEHAKEYAGANGVVIEIRAPKGSYEVHAPTQKLVNSVTNIRFKGRVRPEWLRVAELRTAVSAASISYCISAIHTALLESLPPVLLKTYAAGGDAGFAVLKKMRGLGDVEGHEFHGNQYIAGTVLGKDGEPLTLFHGSTAKSMTTRTLDLNATRVRAQTTPNGVAFTSDERAAHGYARTPGKMSEGGNKFGSVVKANLVLKNPLDITKDVKVGQKKGMTFGDAKREALKKLTSEHDGMIFRGDRVNNDEYVAFHSHQIREPKQIRGAELRTLKPGTNVKLKMSFDASNPRAAKWAKQHATELADGISETSRERIRNAVERVHEEGDLRESYDEILDAVGDEARAGVIARTETMMAANEGQRESWDQAVESGLLSEDSRVQWIATSGCCDECDALDEEERTLDGVYPDPGEDGPPLHPNCRCTEGIVG
jgi:hypothetical protein